jgi:hypothetical protein
VSISLLLVSPTRSAEPSMVLKRKVLIVADVGRLDFGGPEGLTFMRVSIDGWRRAVGLCPPKSGRSSARVR